MSLLLAIESSCDETSAALLRCADGAVLACVTRSQIARHAAYGGVIPELAARDHLQAISPVVAATFSDAGADAEAVSAVAVTQGPGLVGSLLVGVQYARAFAAALQVPLYGINHLEGHVLAARLGAEMRFPALVVLVSGGHTQLLLARAPGDYAVLGGTVDDAVGEAYDKVARLLELPYPGGPEIMRAAAAGDRSAFALPRPLLHSHDGRISMSGLKTAVIHLLRELGPQETARCTADVAASFEAAVGDVLVRKAAWALEQAAAAGDPVQTIVFTGGVAANTYLRERLQTLADTETLPLLVPEFLYCTDNAAMIGAAALARIERGDPADTELEPRSRWPLG